jgi:adenylate cyclase
MRPLATLGPVDSRDWTRTVVGHWPVHTNRRYAKTRAQQQGTRSCPSRGLSGRCQLLLPPSLAARHKLVPLPSRLSMFEILLILLIVTGVALAAVSFLWLRERRRAGWLEIQLENELAEREAWSLAPLPPLKAVLRAASRVREEGLGELLWISFDELTAWAEDAEPELRELAAKDGTLTILFSDIEGSTALNQKLGDKSWLRTLGAHDQIVRRCAGGHGGHVVKSQGDGFMIAFAGAEDAIRSAIEIQRKLDSGPRRLRGAPIRVRIGIHTGSALQKDGDLFGRSVALAARVADQASGGEILVTAEAAEATEAADLVFAESREVELKGLPGSHELVAVVWQDS